MDFDRLKLLEQRMDIMQKEVNTVLHEMQTTIQLIAKTYSVAIKVMGERVDILEKGTSDQPAREDTNGKEL